MRWVHQCLASLAFRVPAGCERPGRKSGCLQRSGRLLRKPFENGEGSMKTGARKAGLSFAFGIGDDIGTVNVENRETDYVCSAHAP